MNMNNQNNTKHFKIIIAILAVALATAIAILLLFTSGVSETNSSRSSDTTANQLGLTHYGYELEQVVVLSRHNIRSPLSGSLKNACTVSDALVLQYYEEKDLRKAAFNHSLTFDEWKAIGQVKDVYGDVLFSAPLVSVNVAHPLLIEIDTHKFTEKGISHYQIRCDCKACGHVWFINAG